MKLFQSVEGNFLDETYLRMKDLVTLPSTIRKNVENKIAKGEWKAYRQDYILENEKPVVKKDL